MKRVGGIAIFLALWQLFAIVLHNKIFPAPTAVWLAFMSSWNTVLIHCGYSFMRLLAGVAVAIMIGLPIGLLLGYFKKAGDILLPLVYMLGPIPKVALLPLIMVLFGIGNISKIFIIFIIVVFQIIIVTCDAVRNIPEQYFMSFRVVRAKSMDIIKHIVLPSAIPELCTSLRVGLATSISVLFFAENYGTRWGLGFYIMDKWMQMDYPKMYLGICVMGMIGLLCVAAVDFAEKKACPWK